jgi:hypothetical protein
MTQADFLQFLSEHGLTVVDGATLASSGLQETKVRECDQIAGGFSTRGRWRVTAAGGQSEGKAWVPSSHPDISFWLPRPKLPTR